MPNPTQPQNPEQVFGPEIRRARFDKLTIYEVAESELVILEKGSPDSIYLNFAIFLLSMALSFTIALLTTTTFSTVILVFLIVCVVVGYIGGFFLLILWYRNRSSVSDCIKTIQRRLPPEGMPESMTKIEENKQVRA
jgi:hypothetical protein